jgi:hypothetical protein
MGCQDYGEFSSLFHSLTEEGKRSSFTEVHTMKILPSLVPIGSLDSENIEL